MFRFFALAFALSLPFWLFGALVDQQLLPGLPVSSLMAVVPAVTACFLTYRAEGAGALRDFAKRAFDYDRMCVSTWLLAVFTMPAVMLLAAALQLAWGQTLPPPEVHLGRTAALFGLFLFAGITEELGWTGYATRPLVQTYGLFRAGAILGVVAVLWHVIPLLQAERAADWIAWWALGTVARRILIVWLFARGGESVFSASLFHAMSNLCWMLFPVMGSHFDPKSNALVVTCFAASVLLAQRRKSA